MAYTIIKTERIALQLALDLWAFLKSTGDEKEDYLSNIQSVYLAGCPLCQFYLHQNPEDHEKRDNDLKWYRSGCVKCPLGRKTLCRFTQLGSAYSRWAYANVNDPNYLKDKMKYAEIIYQAILKRKQKLEAKNEKAID